VLETTGDKAFVEQALKWRGGNCKIDAGAYIDNVLYIWEYKSGRRKVPAFENQQLIGYYDALASANFFSDQSTRVVFRVIQPRCYQQPFDSWTLPAVELRPYVNRLHARQELALAGGACETGEHCRDCDYKLQCSQFLDAASSYMSYIGEPSPTEMTADALAAHLDILDDAEKHLSAMTKAATGAARERVQKGENIRGWVTQPAYGRKTWSCPVQQVRALGEMFGIPLTEEKPCTPSQALKKGIDKSLISNYTTVPQNGIKLVRDKNNEAARRAF
jgi:hypothetical protein